MMNSQHDARERWGFGSRWIKDKNDLGAGYSLSPREEGLKLLRQMKALRDDNLPLLEKICANCGRWVLVMTYGDEPYGESQIAQLHNRLKALNVDVKNLRESAPPPKPQPRQMDGGKLLAKMKGLKADQPEDFKLVVESHKWLATKVTGMDAFNDEEVSALLATLDEMAIDVKLLREQKPDLDKARLLYKLRGLDAYQADDFDRLKALHPWVAERIAHTAAPSEEESVTLVEALTELGIDLTDVREVRKPRIAKPAQTHGRLPRVNVPVASSAATSGKLNRWASAREANERLTLPMRTEPVTAPDSEDQSVPAQLFRQVVVFANGKNKGTSTAVKFGKLVRRLATTSIPDLAADMIQHGAFAGMNTYRAGEELEERLSGLGNWNNTDMAALLTSLKVDPVDILKECSKKT